MSWRDAPIAIHTQDVALEVSARASTWTATDALLADRCLGAALDLLEAVSLALSFPETRSAHQTAADAAIVRLRVTLRVARDRGLSSAGWHRMITGRLAVIGRMLGGWRKRRSALARGPPA